MPAAQPVLSQIDEVAALHEVETFANTSEEGLANWMNY